MTLFGQVVGTRYAIRLEADGYVVTLGAAEVDGPYPFWTAAWIAAHDLERSHA